MKILLLSAYHAQSHAYWAEQLIKQMPEHNWQLVTLSPRYFAWRLRGNALSFKQQYQQTLSESFDVIIATSMTDLAMLKALYPHFNSSRCVLYFHENQFAYPKNANQQMAVEQQMLSVYSAEVADELVFNSEFNRDSFLHGVKTLVQKLPDGIDKQLSQTFASKAKVLAVPVQLPKIFPKASKTQGPLHIVWAARWEYDKGPEVLLAVVKALVSKQFPFVLHVLGQSFRQRPEAFDTLENNYRGYLGAFGFVASQKQYWQLLAQSDVFLSTAHHEFYGISVAEAKALGCQLLLPNTQVYPSLYKGRANFYEDVKSCVSLIMSIPKKNKQIAQQSLSHAQMQQQQLTENYRHWLNNLIDND